MPWVWTDELARLADVSTRELPLMAIAVRPDDDLGELARRILERVELPRDRESTSR